MSEADTIAGWSDEFLLKRRELAGSGRGGDRAEGIGMTSGEDKISDLRDRLAASEDKRRGDYDALIRQVRYWQSRAEPVQIRVDRGNYDEMFQILHPIDQERLRDFLMKRGAAS